MTTLVFVLAAAPCAAQRPDFSGEWTSGGAEAPSVASQGDASFRRGDMGSGWGSTITLAQTADSLVLSYVFFAPYDLQPPLRYAFSLSGAESRNTIMIGHASEVQRSRTAWNGRTLVITTLYPAPPGAVPVPGAGGVATTEVRRALTLESASSLVVETTRPGVMGGPSSTTRTVYTKR